ncbi:MAG: hypothetical protein Q4A74_02685 [Cardiobacteriaceae bacterium]|nr:hypothetical protein [Cardiobacteriaceae bacterium]
MIRPFSFLLLIILLTACGTQTPFLKEVPVLAPDDNEFWVYYCDKGIEMQVDYANMGGEYTATLKLPESKRVLERDHGFEFSDDEYRWQSEDGLFFRLTREENVIYNQCSARRKLDKNAVYIR